MIRILHAADLHLDGSFEALAPEQAAQRREDERQMLRRLAELCRERACDLLLLAGDVFASSTVSRETVELLLELLGGLDTKVFIAPGSSDPYTPESVYATVRWPENVHIFKTREISTVRLTDPDICVCGAAFQEPREGGLLRDFMAPEEGIPTIMVLHGVLGDPASPYDPISEQEIRNSRLRYLALGHQHRASGQVQRTVGAAAFDAEPFLIHPALEQGRGLQFVLLVGVSSQGENILGPQAADQGFRGSRVSPDLGPKAL